MSTLILHPTEQAQWLELIREAEKTCRHDLGDELKSYLVFLLMRYIGAGQLAGSIIALEYLHGLMRNGKVRENRLSEVGDKCLLFSGLFPGRASRRRVKISYYVELGASAYATLGQVVKGGRMHTYNLLAKHFVILMDILHATRETGSGLPALEPLQAIEVWSDTGSAHALENLRHYTRAMPVKTGLDAQASGLEPDGYRQKMH